VSAVKPTDDGQAFLVRLYNPTAFEASARLVGSAGASRVYLSDETGRPGKPVEQPVRVPPLGTVVLCVAR
jgi:hypothetical protein